LRDGTVSGLGLSKVQVPVRITRSSSLELFRALRGREAACTRCGRPDAYALRDGRLRCRDCRYTFHEFAGTWLDRVKLPPEYWLALLRDFAHGLSVEDMARRLALSYATIFKACHAARLASLAACGEEAAWLLDARGEAVSFCRKDHKVEQSHCLECRSPVFCVDQGDRGGQGNRGSRGGRGLRVRLLPKATARHVFGLDLPLKCWRTLLYTGPFRGHDGLVFSCCKKARELHSHRYVNDALPLDRQGGFMDRAEPWMARYHCLSPQTYYLYLKEIELRCNCPDQELVPALARRLVQLVPNSRD